MTFLLTVIVICLVITLLRMRNRIGELSDRVSKLERATEVVAQPLSELQPEPESEPLPAAIFDPAPGEKPLYTADKIPAPLPDLTPQPILAPLTRALRSNQEWELLVGGNLLNKLGALILVIGIALFLGYSLEHVTPAGRAAIAVAISLTSLLAGNWVEKKGQYKIFARGLIGAGWAALYATSYAMYAVPAARVISDPFLGSIVVVAVAAAMVWHSLRYRSQGITAIAYFTAFAAMAVTPSSPFAVLGLLPLAASLLYLAWRFEWHPMALYGLGATYLTCISRGNSDAPLAATQSLFFAYWLLFEAFDLLRVKRRLLAGGQDLLFPLNAICFLGLSYLAWNAHSPERLWIAAAFAAALFLVDSVIRAGVRPPSTFPGGATLSEKLRAGSFEGAFFVSAVLAGLSVVSRVPGVWAGVSLGVEAEIVYLAGVRLRSSFLRGLGSRAFILSAFKTLGTADASGQSTLPDGHVVWNWEPPLLFHAVLFYLNRGLQRSVVMSTCAAAIVATVLIAEFSVATLGVALVVFGLTLFEIGLRKRLAEFRAQGALLLIGGVFAASLGIAHRGAWIGHAICLAMIYATAVRTRWIDSVEPRERDWFALGTSISATVLSALLAWRLTSEPYLGVVLWALAIVILELGARKLPSQMRLCFGPLALLAFAVVVLHIDKIAKFPPTSVWLEYAAMSLATLAATARLTRSTLRDALFVLSSVSALAVSWMLVPDPFVTIAWTAIAAALLIAGMWSSVRDARLHSYGIAGAAFLCALWHDITPPRLGIAGITAAAFYGGQYLTKRFAGRTPPWVSAYFSVLGTLLLSALLYGQASGGLLTVSWGAQGLLLLGAGFALHQRVLRLQGLGLLLTCILKLFLYDLRNLETVYRILSFVVLGLILLGVSWIYSRFREKVLRLL